MQFPFVKESKGFVVTLDRLFCLNEKLYYYSIINKENGLEVFRYKNVTFSKAKLIFDSIVEEIE